MKNEKNETEKMFNVVERITKFVVGTRIKNAGIRYAWWAVEVFGVFVLLHLWGKVVDFLNYVIWG